MGSAGLVGCRPGDRTSGGRTAGGRSPLQLPAFGPERHAGWGDDQALPRARLLGGVSADGRRGDGDGRSRADPRRGEPRFEPPARKRFYDHRAPQSPAPLFACDHVHAHCRPRRPGEARGRAPASAISQSDPARRAAIAFGQRSRIAARPRCGRAQPVDGR